MSLLNGLSAMGAAVSNTAGNAALEQQKSDLESQKEILANQLAGQREHVGRVESGEIAATAAGKQQQFESGQQTERLSTETALEASREGSAQTIAGMDIAGRHQDVQAQIKAGALETGVDADSGNTLVINKLTGKSTPLLGMDGKPLNLVNPAQAQLARDVVISTNEQVRAATQQYRIASGNAQKDVADALKAASGDQKDPDVLAARQRQQDITDQYNESIKSLNDNVSAQVNAALHRAKLTGTAAPTPTDVPFTVSGAAATMGNAAPVDFAKTGASSSASIPVPPAYADKPDGTVLAKGGKNFVKRGGQLVPQ